MKYSLKPKIKFLSHLKRNKQLKPSIFININENRTHLLIYSKNSIIGSASVDPLLFRPSPNSIFSENFMFVFTTGSIIKTYCINYFVNYLGLCDAMALLPVSHQRAIYSCNLCHCRCLIHIFRYE